MKNWCAVLLLCCLALTCQAGLWNRGKLTVNFTDVDGLPITDATLVVRTRKCIGWSHGGDSDYNTITAKTDKKGVAIAVFSFLDPEFEWDVITPSHYSDRLGFQKESFDSEIEDDCLYGAGNSDEAERIAEIKKLSLGNTVEDYTNLVEKLKPKKVTYTGTVIERSVSFYPKRNPRPMCAYTRHQNTRMPMKDPEIISDNGVEVKHYRDVEFDMERGGFLPPWGGRGGRNKGVTSDFKVVRYHANTNGDEVVYGWIEFAPGCGACKMKKKPNDSFPSVYEADTNAVYVNRIPFEYHCANGQAWDAKTILAEDEFMVLRTRVMMDDTGSITNCHYSKIIGEMWAGEDLYFNASIFNPTANDTNLEFDMSRNTAKERYGSGGLYCP